jgi:hypothetical protein
VLKSGAQGILSNNQVNLSGLAAVLENVGNDGWKRTMTDHSSRNDTVRQADEPETVLLEGSPIHRVLDRARWAPSGDNTQPWRFELLGPDRARVHGFDTRDFCVYDLDGWASRLAIGAMLETLRIAASALGMRVAVVRDRSAPEEKPVFDVQLIADDTIQADALAPCIETRRVQRRALSRRALTSAEKQALSEALGPDYSLTVFEGDQRSTLAKLMFDSAHIRLTIEEGWKVHSTLIEWGVTESEDRMPAAAVGLSMPSLLAMRMVIGSWPLTRFFSVYLGGTLLPRVELDLIPGLRCAGHVMIRANEAPGARAGSDALDADFEAGRAVQRFWLTAEKLGLQHQPEMTPLLFSRFSANGLRFTTDARALRTAARIRERLEALAGGSAERERIVWMGRIGEGPVAKARSIRLPLARLLHRG